MRHTDPQSFRNKLYRLTLKYTKAHVTSQSDTSVEFGLHGGTRYIHVEA